MLYLGSQKVVPVIERPSVKREVVSGVFSMPTNAVDFILPDNATDIGDYALYYAFYKSLGIRKFSTNKVTTVTGKEALENAFRDSSITEADMSSIVSITGNTSAYNTFNNCKSLTKLNLGGLETISVAMQRFCEACTALAEIDFSSLESVTVANGCYYMFHGCTSLTNVTFPKLSSIAVSYAFQYMFYGCKNMNIYFPALTTNSFGSYTNQFGSFFYGGTDNTVHFPSNLESTLSSWNFSGTRTTKLFDLPETE